MSSRQENQTTERSDSPDPSSHATNTYDTVPGESEIDELDDDDMDFEPTTDDSEDAEFLDADGGTEDFHGMSVIVCYNLDHLVKSTSGN